MNLCVAIRVTLVAVCSAGCFSQDLQPGSFDFRFDAGTPLTAEVDRSPLGGDWNLLTLPDDSMLAINPLAGRMYKFRPDGRGEKEFFLNAPSGAQVCITNSQGEILMAASGTNGMLRILRLSPNGTLDLRFQGATFHFPARARAMALQKDGKILVGGYALEGNPMVRLHPSGAIDSLFVVNGATEVEHIQIQGNGDIVIAGSALTSVNGISRNKLARLKPNGALDDTYNPGPNLASRSTLWIYSILCDSNDNLYLAGSFSAVEAEPRVGVVRLTPSGALDRAFSPDFGPLPYLTSWRFTGMHFDRAGRLLLAGSPKSFRLKGSAVEKVFDSVLSRISERKDGKLHVIASEIGGRNVLPLAQLFENGTHDISFNPPGPNAAVRQIKALPSGEIVIAGDFGPRDRLETFPSSGVAVLNSDGSRSSRLHSTFYKVHEMTANSDYVFVIAQETWRSDAIVVRLDLRNPQNIARLESDAPYSSFSKLLALRNGQVLIGGIFIKSGRKGLVRFNSDLSVDLTWNVPALIDPLLEDSDGSIYAGGSGSVNRWNRDGSRDSTFSAPGFYRLAGGGSGELPQWVGADIRAVGLDRQQRLLVIGNFSRAGSEEFHQIVRLLPNGSLDRSFRPTLMGTAHDILTRRDGGALVAVGNTIVEIRSTTWRQVDANGPVYALAQDQNGSLYAGGDFTSLARVPSPFVGRLWCDNLLVWLDLHLSTTGPVLSLHSGLFSNLVLETSSELKHWTEFQKVISLTNRHMIELPKSNGHQFFRARTMTEN